MAHLKKWYAVNNHSHFHKKLFTIGCESAFTINANCRSRCMRIVVHDRCEYALRSEAIKNNLTTSEISQIKLGMDEETHQKISNKLDTIDHRISLAKIMKLILPALIVAFAFCIIWFNRV
jgi:hypothetical protein